MGLGVDFVKLDAPGRPEIFTAAEKYLEITEAHCSQQYNTLPKNDRNFIETMPKISSGYPIYTVNPSVSNSLEH